MSERLVRKKSRNPGIAIDFITDPVNTVYGGSISPELEELKEAGINVIVSDLGNCGTVIFSILQSGERFYNGLETPAAMA